MSEAKRYYVRHNTELDEATRECDCRQPCQKVVLAADYDALVLRLDECQTNIETLWDQIADRDKIIEELAKRAGEAERRLHKSLDALSELVSLKDLKNKHGKTEKYLERQPLAWIAACQVLSDENWRNAGPAPSAPSEGEKP